MTEQNTLPLSPSSPDWERAIVARLHAGDEDALRELFLATHHALLEVVTNQLGTFDSSLPDPLDAADEIIRDAFLQLWRRRATLDVQGRLVPYLFGAVRRHMIGYLRRRGRDVARAKLLAAEVAAGERLPGTGEFSQRPPGITRPEEWDVLWQAVRELPPGQRTILLLRWRHGFSCLEIAQLLEVSVRTVETQHLRAIKRLRQALPKRKTPRAV